MSTPPDAVALAAPPPLRHSAPHAVPTGAAAPRPRVLLVDDEANILTALRRLLRREPYELLAAPTAADALRVMEAGPVQLIMTDYRMPGMAGTELLRQVQQRWPDTIRIVLSGYSEVKAIISAINDGAIYKFLVKPWNDEEIKLHIRRALEQSALQAENRRLTHEVTQQNDQLRQLNQLLDQRANDASAGLTCAQTLLETVDLGVAAIDEDGLVVTANLRAVELLAEGGTPLIGVSARVALPEALHRILPGPGQPAARACGGFRHRGLCLQWRCQPLATPPNTRACVLAIWKNVSCKPT